ncbi:penicillin-binding protein [Fusobacterium polymorphum]|uniref:Penicillin-binding protein n=1 Tax=Fusobacterium nucleatum subsp. polymorphum TaxID=76857 RepID=A0A2C6BJF5_FUSNP|nr:penicillin-binding protein [Fusobacterium polymorphum]PHI04383.1 penicillin-binding protein [Fusobacterium polymorphum]
MKTINFYKKDKLIFSVYAESLEDVLKSPLSYFPAYTADMIITDITYQYPIFKDDVLREMAKEEKVRSNIPVQLEDGEIIKDKKLIVIPKPAGNQKYMYWDKEKSLWILDNQKEYDDYCALIDNLKAEALAYGFDYKVDGKEHRQKCRDKDITLLASNVTFMLAEKTLFGKEKPITWYFEDNFGLELNLEKSSILASYGKTFTQSVYDTEHYFKTKVNPKELTKAEFESKRKEIHSNLAKG